MNFTRIDLSKTWPKPSNLVLGATVFNISGENYANMWSRSNAAVIWFCSCIGYWRDAVTSSKHVHYISDVGQQFQAHWIAVSLHYCFSVTSLLLDDALQPLIERSCEPLRERVFPTQRWSHAGAPRLKWVVVGAVHHLWMGLIVLSVLRHRFGGSMNVFTLRRGWSMPRCFVLGSVWLTMLRCVIAPSCSRVYVWRRHPVIAE